MERRSVETIAQTLNQSGVRFLVAGDMAVVAHGLVRFTADPTSSWTRSPKR